MASTAVAFESDLEALNDLIAEASDEQLRELIKRIQGLLSKRDEERKQAARERALAILREAGLDSLEIPRQRRARQ